MKPSLFYSPHPVLNKTVLHQPAWDREGNRVAFFAKTSAMLQPRGIARLPDGGKPRVLHETLSLYIFHRSTLKLDSIIELPQLVQPLERYHPSITMDMRVTDDSICFMVQPATPWEWYASRLHRTKHLEQLKDIMTSFSRPLDIHLASGSLTTVETEYFNSLKKFPDKLSFSTLNQELDQLPLRSWGLDLMTIFPKQEKDYINDTIYCNNPSSLTRRAVIEQVISLLDGDKITTLLKKMDRYEQKLKGSHQQEYSLNAQSVREQLKKIVMKQEKIRRVP